MTSKIPNHTVEEWSHFLHRVSIFSELEEGSIKEVASSLQPLSLPKGSVLYREGDAGDALYIIQSGRVKIVTRKDGGQERVLNYLGRGDTLGEMSLLTDRPRSVTAKVDNNASFLVLYKKDFDVFLKKNPTASLYLSRLISQRFAVAFKPSEPKPELLACVCDLEMEDQIVLLVNLSLALTEQTRRKVLLLDLSPAGPKLVESLGMKPVLSSPGMVTAEDLNHPAILNRIAVIHPSGLEIITLSYDFFSGVLFRSLPSFLASLRNFYDLVLVNLPGRMKNGSKGLDEIPRAVLQECDTVYYIFSDQTDSLSALESFVQEKENPDAESAQNFESIEAPPSQKLKKVLLQTSIRASLSDAADFTVPWNSQIPSTLKRMGHPYLTGAETVATHRVLNRVARAMGKIQVGLAMGSGAAYGYTIIGMLKVFEREKIPIDFISGTSMGALLGSFYSSGKTVDEIEQIAYSITKTWLRRNFLSDLNLPWPHGGILIGQTISRFLKSVLGEVQFDELKTPFSCVATDIMTGDAIVFREGKVWQAVRASLSLPLIFCPYKMGNRFLVDGGLVNPVPTALIASMGADILISVNLTGKVSERKVSLRRMGIFPAKSPGMFNIFFKMIYTMQYQIALSRTDLSHVVIRPDTRNFSWIDFHKAKQIIPLGEEAAEEALTKIKSRLPFFSDTCRIPPRWH